MLKLFVGTPWSKRHPHERVLLPSALTIVQLKLRVLTLLFLALLLLLPHVTSAPASSPLPSPSQATTSKPSPSHLTPPSPSPVLSLIPSPCPYCLSANKTSVKEKKFAGSKISASRTAEQKGDGIVDSGDDDGVDEDNDDDDDEIDPFLKEEILDNHHHFYPHQAGRPLTASERRILTSTLSPPSLPALPPVLRPLHNRLFIAYPRWHARMRRTSRPRLLVYSIGPHQPGVGDRLLALASLYIYAAATDRVLLLHWRGPFSLRSALRPNKVDVFFRLSSSSSFSSSSRTKSETFDPSARASKKNASTANEAAKEKIGSSKGPSSGVARVAYCSDPRLVAAQAAAASPRVLFVNASVAVRAADAARLLGFRNDVALRERPGRDVDVLSAALLGRVLAVMFRPTVQFRRVLVAQAGPLLRGGFVAAHARLGTGVREGGPRFMGVDTTCVADQLLNAALSTWPSSSSSASDSTNSSVAEEEPPCKKVKYKRKGIVEEGCYEDSSVNGRNGSRGSSDKAHNGDSVGDAGEGKRGLRKMKLRKGKQNIFGRVFIATDTPDFRIELAEHAAGRAVVLAGEWETRHVAQMRTESRSDRQAFWNSLVELVVVGRACRVVAMGSRFSVVGAMLGGMSAENVVDHGLCGTPASSQVIGSDF